MQRLFTLWLCMLGSYSYGQVGFGFKVGATANTARFSADDASGGTDVLSGLNITLDHKHYGMGVAVERGMLRFCNAQNEDMRSEAPFYYANLFIHRKINLKKSYLYFGVNAGMLNFYDNERRFLIGSHHYHEKAPRHIQSDLTLGSDAGYAAPLNKHVYFHAEAGFRYVSVRSAITADATPLLYFPVSVGFNYTFSKRKQPEKKEVVAE